MSLASTRQMAALVVLGAALSGLLAGCGTGSEKTSEEIGYRCECPVFVETVAAAPAGASTWWPTEWVAGVDLSAVYVWGYSDLIDPKEAQAHLRERFRAAGWAVSEDPNELEPGVSEWTMRAPATPDGRVLRIRANEFEGRLVIAVSVLDSVKHYDGWNDDRYIRAIDEGAPELSQLDARREEKAADLYRALVLNR